MPVGSLEGLAAGSQVLIDANIFIYAANRRSRHCVDFLDRCAREEIRGATTVEVLGEVCHRLMLEEALATGVVTRAAASALRRKRQAIRSLRSYWPLVAKLLDSNLLTLDLDQSRFRRAQLMREQYGLLANDSLVLAAADTFGIDDLATDDDDFEHVEWLTVHKPGDIS
jgi:predicted nucleic acid-binding protein